MIELKEEFTKRGINLRQLFKDNDLVIYEIRQLHIDDDDEYSTWYEVFKYTVCKPNQYHNDEYERYPNDEAFGDWAWSCSNWDCVKKVLKREFPNHPMNG